MTKVTWGIDGFGIRYYICEHCELSFGNIDINDIEHDCDKSKSKYSNRGITYGTEQTGTNAESINNITIKRVK